MALTLSVEEREKYASEYLEMVLKLSCPKDTANLSTNGIRIDKSTNDILIGGEIAPYAIYTNEPWTSPKWHGRTNPNEGWINKAIDSALPMMRSIFGGVYSKKDIESKQVIQEEQFYTQLDDLANEKGK